MPASIRQHLANRISAWNLLRRGNQQFKNGRFDRAAEFYAVAVELRPNASAARYNLGLCLYKLGKRKEARAQWTIAVAELGTRNPYLTEQLHILLRQFS